MPSIVVKGVTYQLPPDDTQATKVPQYNEALIALAGAGTAIWARAYHNAAQSITNDTLTAVALNSERYDTDTIHDNSTNNSRLTCKTAGVYSIKGTLSYAANAVGYRDAAIRLNGSTYLAFQRQPAVVTATEQTIVTVTTDYPLAVNDYVELIAKQNSGGSLNIESSANYSPEFMMTRIGS